MENISFEWAFWNWSIFKYYLLDTVLIILPLSVLLIFLAVFLYKTVYRYNFDYSSPTTAVNIPQTIMMRSALLIIDACKVVLSILFIYWNIDINYLLLLVMSGSTILSMILSISISDYVNHEKNCWSWKYAPLFKIAGIFDFIGFILLVMQMNYIVCIAFAISIIVRLISCINKVRSFMKIKSTMQQMNDTNMLIITNLTCFAFLVFFIYMKAYASWNWANLNLSVCVEIFCKEYSNDDKIAHLSSVGKTGLKKEVRKYFESRSNINADFIAEAHIEALVNYISYSIYNHNESKNLKDFLERLLELNHIRKSFLQSNISSSSSQRILDLLPSSFAMKTRSPI